MSASAAKETSATGQLDPGYLRSLFQGAGIAIVACKPDGVVVACNAAASKLFAPTRLTESQTHVSALFPEKDRPKVAELVETCLTTFEPCEYHTRFGGSEADPLDFAVWCTPVLEADGTVLGVSLWLRDITKRKRLQRKLKKTERLTYLGQLSGAVAHHYNNLLFSIAASVEYAMNMNTITAMRRALQRSAEAIGRAADMTRQLLAFAQADHRSRDRADLTEMVLYYFDRNEQRLGEHGIRLLLDWQTIPVCPVPREHLTITLENLVDNAIDAMPDGGTLSVTLARRDQTSVCLSLTDTGDGISVQDMEHLFEPFYTSKGVLGSGKSTNAGLGLAVAHGLVSEMHGIIAASNVPGGGARLNIVLPIVEQS